MQFYANSIDTGTTNVIRVDGMNLIAIK